MHNTIRLFIVDDHYMVIEGIRSLLVNDKDMECIGHAMTASSCLAFLQQDRPDVILMDINLPDISGVDLCKEVKEKYPSVFIIGLSTFNQLTFIEKMMENGASGYVLKNASREELLEAITTVAKGKTYLSMEASKTIQHSTADKIFITRREKEVLKLIAEGMTNNAIAQTLFISSATVDSHRMNLLSKFGAKNTAFLIRIATQLEMI